MSETGARAADDPGPARHAAQPETEPETEPQPETEPEVTPEIEHEVKPETEAESEAEPPSWWHRSHPTFAALMGFFTGIGFVILVPGIYATLLNAFAGEKTAERLFPFVLIALVVPIALLFPRKTRRFAQLMLVGMVATIIVVAATTALVLWILISVDK